MLIELCAKNYTTHDGWVNGTNGLKKKLLQLLQRHIFG
jgi:hypothetical protein